MRRNDIMMNVLGDDFEHHEMYEDLKVVIDEIEEKVNDIIRELESNNEDKADDALEIAEKLSNELY